MSTKHNPDNEAKQKRYKNQKANPKWNKHLYLEYKKSRVFKNNSITNEIWNSG